MKRNLLLRLCMEFSLSIISYCDDLEVAKKYVLARQLLKAGTSIGANSMEAQNSEGVKDFVHRIKIAAKEADEAQYWLLLCDQAYHSPECKDLLSQLDVIQRLLNKIITSSKKNERMR